MHEQAGTTLAWLGNPAVYGKGSLDGSEACVGSFSRNRRPRVRSHQPVEYRVAFSRGRRDSASGSFSEYNRISTGRNYKTHQKQ
jgi:hypothetical protein